METYLWNGLQDLCQRPPSGGHALSKALKKLVADAEGGNMDGTQPLRMTGRHLDGRTGAGGLGARRLLHAKVLPLPSLRRLSKHTRHQSVRAEVWSRNAWKLPAHDWSTPALPSMVVEDLATLRQALDDKQKPMLVFATSDPEEAKVALEMLEADAGAKAVVFFQGHGDLKAEDTTRQV